MQMDQLLAWDEAIDPDEVAPAGADLARKLVHLGGDLWSVRAARGDHDLVARVELENRGQQEWKPLLPGDTTVEERVRTSGVHTVAGQRLGRRLPAVDLRIDAVVDDVH